MAKDKDGAFNPWLDLSIKAFEFGLDAQRVIALRMVRLAAGGLGGQAELNRMVIEKIAALTEAQTTAAAALMNGHDDHAIADKVLRVYHKRVRANRRRLSRRRNRDG
jgi:hypothetical protein